MKEENIKELTFEDFDRLRLKKIAETLLSIIEKGLHSSEEERRFFYQLKC